MEQTNELNLSYREYASNSLAAPGLERSPPSLLFAYPVHRKNHQSIHTAKDGLIHLAKSMATRGWIQVP